MTMLKKIAFVLAFFLLTLAPGIASHPTFAEEPDVKEATVTLLPDGATEVASVEAVEESDAPLAPEATNELMGCYSGAAPLLVRRLPATSPGVAGLAWGPHVATASCRDVNFRSQRNIQARAILISTGRPCAAGWVTVPANSWRVLCSNVADGTRFNVQIRSSVTLSNFYIWSAH